MASEDMRSKKPHKFEPGMVVQRTEDCSSWAQPVDLFPVLVLSAGAFDDFEELDIVPLDDIERIDEEYIKVLRADGQIVICQSWPFRVLLEPQWMR